MSQAFGIVPHLDVEAAISEAESKDWDRGIGLPNLEFTTRASSRFRKVSFAISKGKSLEREIEFLRKCVASLTKGTTDRYRDQQHNPSNNGTPSKVEVDESRELFALHRKLAIHVDGIAGLIKANHPDKYFLGLLFDDQHSCAGLLSDLASFTTQLLNTNSNPFELIKCPVELDSIGIEIESQHNMTPIPTHDAEPISGSLTKSYRYIFQNLDVTRKDVWRQNRAKAILGFVSWTVLLWQGYWNRTDDPNTPPHGLCTCRIHFFQSSLRGHLDLETHVLAFHQNGEHHRNHQQRLVCLGLVIAELILMAPISSIQDANSTGYPFQIWDQALHRWSDPMSLRTLVDRVRNKSSTGVAQAVKFCFQDATLADRDAHNFHPEYLRHYVTKVFKP
jgi:hypothetical protein